MRKILYLCAAAVCCWGVSGDANASKLSDVSSAVVKKNHTAVKLAAVNFILKEDELSYETKKNYDGPGMCPPGSEWSVSHGICLKSCNGFNFDSEPDNHKGTTKQCDTGIKSKWKYDKCNEGWGDSNQNPNRNGNCKKFPCDGYPFTESMMTATMKSRGTYEQCKSGDDYKYRFTACNEGYELEGAACKEADCSSYPSLSSVIEGCSATNRCKSGSTWHYVCTECNSDGYVANNGLCSATCSLSATQKPAHCKTADSCSRSGTTYYGSCTDCDPDYDLKNGACELKPVVCTKVTKPGSCYECKTACDDGCAEWKSTQKKCGKNEVEDGECGCKKEEEKKECTKVENPGGCTKCKTACGDGCAEYESTQKKCGKDEVEDGKCGCEKVCDEACKIEKRKKECERDSKKSWYPLSSCTSRDDRYSTWRAQGGACDWSSCEAASLKSTNCDLITDPRELPTGINCQQTQGLPDGTVCINRECCRN